VIEVKDIAFGLSAIGLLLLLGKLLRIWVPGLKRVFMPTSVIAGLLGLLLGADVLGRLVGFSASEEAWLAGGIYPEGALSAMRDMPGVLINVIFAALFLGRTIVSPKKLWRMGGPHWAFGMILSWGQYVIGLLLVVALLAPLLDLNPMAGALIEISFTGGHGTVAGLADTFEELGFPEGQDLGLGLATIGVIAGLLMGIAMINIRERWGKGPKDPPDGIPPADEDQQPPPDPDERRIDITEEGFDTFSWHMGILVLAISIGWLLHQGLILLEQQTWQRLGLPELMRFVPLFPLAMVGGAVVQYVAQKAGLDKYIHRDVMSRFSGWALDITIVAAIATVALDVLGANVWAFVSLSVAALVWNLAAFWWIAPRIIPTHVFNRGMGDFGQASGMVVSGLLLIKISDPKDSSDAVQSFSYKQLMFEPLVGGGLFTAASLPLIAQFGPWAFLIFSACVVVSVWIMARYVFFR
jgi:glutamate:Na+ symporter, ESS family